MTSRRILCLCIAMPLLLAPIGAAAETAAAHADAAAGRGEDAVLRFRARDGVELVGRLRMPPGKRPEKLVVYVNGSGPNTYDDRRRLAPGVEFNYFDLFAQECVRRGMAFFSYDSRGVSASEEPPTYEAIDEQLYATYLPTNEIADVEVMVSGLRSRPGLERARVVLLGWSAGTAIAPRVALDAESGRGPQIDALILCGYMHRTMDLTLEWQNSGEPSAMFYRQYFDADRDGKISKAELEADPYKILPALGMEGGSAFANLDLNGDGSVTAADFGAMLAPRLAAIRSAIDSGDDAWLAANYPVRLTSAWFKDYRANMGANADILPRLGLPIHIFHGELDRNVPVQGALDAAALFAGLGKDNLTLHTFPGHDHDLNYALYPLRGQLSPALAELFETLGRL